MLMQRLCSVLVQPFRRAARIDARSVVSQMQGMVLFGALNTVAGQGVKRCLPGISWKHQHRHFVQSLSWLAAVDEVCAGVSVSHIRSRDQNRSSVTKHAA